MGLKFRDTFGYSFLIKRFVIFIFGIITQYRFNVLFKYKISGSRILKNLPETGVLFVSNHQTYFADVAFLYNVFNCAKYNVFDRINFPWFIFNPKLNIYFIAAKETMKSGFLPKIFEYAGSVSIKRTWREAGKEISRGVDPRDIEKIIKALNAGWVITFPQGTTKPYAIGRRGTAQIIKIAKPIVIPVVIDGFRRAFDKKGLFIKKKGVTLKVTFKPPLEINYDEPAEQIMKQIMDAIEQSEYFQYPRIIKPGFYTSE
ncbi:MAG: lysophospholipid acyltransferase family protein [Thermaurantimonas sp.]